VILVFHIARHGQTEGGRYRCRGVSRSKSIILRLGPFAEAGQPTVLPQSLDLIPTTGQEFVTVGLMADIPDNLVRRRVEYQVQSYGQLDHPETRGQVPTGFRYRGNDRLTQLSRQFDQLVLGQVLDIPGAVDVG